MYVQYHGDIMMYVGDILSTMGGGGYHDVCGGIMNTLRGYLEYCGDTQYREGYYDVV